MPHSGSTLVAEVDSIRPFSVNLKPLIVTFEAFIFIVPVIVDSLFLLEVQSENELFPKKVSPSFSIVMFSEYVPLATYTVEFQRYLKTEMWRNRQMLFLQQ